MNRKIRFTKKLVVTTAALVMLGGGLPIGLGASAYAEQTISSNASSDTTTDRTVTVWKYEIKSTSELGGRGDGETLDPSSAPDLAGKKVMKDVNFELIRVIPKDGVSLTDPLKQKEGTDYTVDSSFTKMTGKTGADGSLTFNVSKDLTNKKEADGIYLVREVKDSSGKYSYTDTEGKTGEVAKPMDPFFVWLPQTKRDDTSKLIYDVNVYPKNIVTDAELDKTIEEGQGYSIKAGNNFQWEATTKLPDGLYFKADKEMIITDVYDPTSGTTADKPVAAGDEVYANYVTVTDDLNTALLLDDIEVQSSTDGSSWTTLTNDKQYTVTLNGTKVVAGNPVTNTTAGDAKKVVVDLTQAGMKELTEKKMPYLRVVYKTHVNKDFNGTISNKYNLNYLIPGQKPVEKESNEPESYNGGFKINKTAESKDTKLEGAEFYIADSEANANAKKYLASDGKSYTLKDDGSSDPVLPSGVTYLTSTSNASGVAQFDGLALNWFTDSNGDGKQDPSITSEATWTKDKIQKDYWIVETKAPSGYELLKKPVQVTVKLDTDTNLVVDVENKKKSDLPFTGGAGMTLLIVIALGAITIGTAAVVIEKKRRAA
ncbi:SpaH/EbpB family LPXTG-anchored major pilin [Enterococcus sp. AZ072]|uniref:SpaH/EbpB family LPXTG-anchored major pilin n=1 Tax=unclassified Enterococcus TaxID=2608891 RepID=UPI003D2D96B6